MLMTTLVQVHTINVDVLKLEKHIFSC